MKSVPTFSQAKLLAAKLDSVVCSLKSVLPFCEVAGALDAVTKARDQYLAIASNEPVEPVHAWFESRVVVSLNSNDRVYLFALYDDFSAYATKNGLKVVCLPTFRKRLYTVLFEAHKITPTTQAGRTFIEGFSLASC